MTERVRIGVIGAGGVAQVEHIPNLLALRHLFQLQCVCDPSASTRAFVSDHFGVNACESLEELLSLPLDAVLIASPDALHKEHILAGLNAGLNVFCEKPLCYAVADIDEVIAARDATGRIVQAGYMKRFDPAFETALANLPGKAKTLRHVSVEVNDPDAWPFIRHHTWKKADDVPAALIAEVAAKQKQQVARAVGMPLDELAFKGFCNAYSSSIVHDVNAVHGLLDALHVPNGQISGARIYAGGNGGHGVVSLLGGQALWTMTHLAVPELPHYRERITLYFDDSSLELEFPSPYLNHQPTRLTIRKGDAHRLHTDDITAGYEEAFIEELKGFHAAITRGVPVRNTPEQARRDMALLAGLTRWHATHSPEPIVSGASA